MRGNPGCRTTEVEYSTGLSSSLCGRKSTALSKLERSKENVAQLQACCIELWHHPDTTQCERDEGYLSQELEWMFMEERRRESAVTGSGRVGIDDTILNERVEFEYVCSSASPHACPSQHFNNNCLLVRSTW